MVDSPKKFHNEDKEQLLVQTPFGKGLVIRTRPGVNLEETMKEVRLIDWDQSVNSLKFSRNKCPMLYTTKDYKSVTPKKGDEVITSYGRGVIEETFIIKIHKKMDKEIDGSNDTEKSCKEQLLFKYRVSLTSWRLAGRSRVKCFVFASEIKVVRSKTLREMDALERIDYAMAQKVLASKLFAQKKYNDALILYAQAVDAVRYVQHTQSTSNESRADLLVVIVTCSNNAATCCIQLMKFEEAGRYAKNALILLNALNNKRGLKIHSVLMQNKLLSDAKIFGEWRAKSCLIIARSESKNDLIAEALGNLKKAKDYISEFMDKDGNNTNSQHKRLKDLLKEILKLKGSIIERRRIIREKEKARAQAMFADKASSNLEISAESKETPSGATNDVCSQAGTIKRSPDIQTHEESEQLNKVDDNNKRIKLQKQVSFAENLEEHLVMDSKEQEESYDKQEPWYEEHKEALVLLTLGGLMCLTTAFGLRKR